VATPNRPLVITVLVVVYVTTFFVAGRLAFEPVKDEAHFSESAATFSGSFGVEELRGYPEIITPLALVVWGQLDRAADDPIRAGRLLNFAISFALLAWIALGTGAPGWVGPSAAAGLLLFPYTLPMSVHLYTDIPAVALAVVGAHALTRERYLLAALAFALSVSTRQYLIQVPAALAAFEGLRMLKDPRAYWKAVASCATAGVVLLGWFAFFGGLAPQAGLDLWIAPYPDPMMHATEFILAYGLYMLALFGAYFVLVEAMLFRPWPRPADLLTARNAMIALALLLLFLVDPPFLTQDQPGGALGRASRLFLPEPAFDGVRITFLYLLALLAVVRFGARLDPAFWLVAAAFVLSMKQQIAWDKYALPTLAVLWTWKATGVLRGYPRATGQEAERAAPSMEHAIR